MEKRPALGKGLSALIPDAPEPPRTSPVELDIDRLTPNSYQPRGQFDDARLEDLARSIRSNGVIQPIVVRRVGDNFHIIAGERRWRAAQKAGLLKVPVVVRDVKEGNDRAVLEMALIENIQREDLNPIEEALAYKRLGDEFQMTQEQIAGAVGKDRATVANFVRLLKPGGILVASVPVTPSVDVNPYHLHDFTPASFRRMFARRGFTEMESLLQRQPYQPLKMLAGKETRLEDMRKNLVGYYAAHPGAALKRAYSTLVDGFCNKYLACAWRYGQLAD